MGGGSHSSSSSSSVSHGAPLQPPLEVDSRSMQRRRRGRQASRQKPDGISENHTKGTDLGEQSSSVEDAEPHVEISPTKTRQEPLQPLCESLDTCVLTNVSPCLLKSDSRTQSESSVSIVSEAVVGSNADICTDGAQREGMRAEVFGSAIEIDEDTLAHLKSAFKQEKIEYDVIGSLISTVQQETQNDDVRSFSERLSDSSSRSKDLTRRLSRQNQTLNERAHVIEEMREKLSSYRPGDWLVETGGMSRKDFAIPEVTTLLVVGPSGAGKSTFINNTIRVLNKKTRGFDRAQVFDGKGNGSYFLQEYIISENAKTVCMFDSRGLSGNDTVEDMAMLKTWVQDGVCHGQAAWRQSDNSMVREALEGRGRHCHFNMSMKREINFVIFVVNAVALCKMKEEGDLVSQEHLARLYKSPYISFKDDRPTVAMTHGDLLSPSERLSSRLFIGELFGISPVDQVFDLSGLITGRVVNKGEEDAVADVVLLDLLEFTLERADRNLPFKADAPSYKRAVGRMVELYNDLGSGFDIALLAIFICWLCCLVLFIAVKFGIIFEGQEHELKKPPWAYRLWHL